jgi:hypothetical protein
VVAGPDQNPFTSAPIRSYDWGNTNWFEFGVSDRAVFDGGSGSASDYGYIDASLVKILPEALGRLQIPTDERLSFIPRDLEDIHSLSGKTVQGFGIASGDCIGVIQSVLVERIDGNSFKADLVIVSPSGEGLTREGDSGMLWHLDDGTWVGQHALGRVEPAGQPSKVTASSFLYRIRSKLKIQTFR